MLKALGSRVRRKPRRNEVGDKIGERLQPHYDKPYGVSGPIGCSPGSCTFPGVARGVDLQCVAGDDNGKQIVSEQI